MKHSEAEQSAVQAGAIPQTMRAAAVERFGGPQALCIHELAVPRPGANEVLIALDTAGVGGWDASFRDGAAKVAPVPARLDLVHAGAIPTIALTALQGVDDALELKRGETLIVHGASGNVGMLAVQFAKRRGAYVIATASGADGAAFVRRLGADAVVDGKRHDIGKAARAAAPHGVDAVLAFVGGSALTRALDLLRKGGRVAHPNGIEPAPKKRRGLKFTAYDGEPGVREFERLAAAIEQAKLQIPLAESFELSEAARAHARLGKGHVLGKIVLRIRAA